MSAPERTLRFGPEGATVTFIVDSGAESSVVNELPDGVRLSGETVMVVGVGGKAQIHRFTEPLTVIDEDGSTTEGAQFVYVPDCPTHLLGRDLIGKLQLVLLVDGQCMRVTKRGQETHLMVLEGTGQPAKFYSLDPVPTGPASVVKELRSLPSQLMQNTMWKPQDKFPLHATLKYSPHGMGYTGRQLREWNRLSPLKIRISTVFWSDEQGWMYAKVEAPHEVDNLRASCLAPLHISLAKGPGMQWKDLKVISLEVCTEDGPPDSWENLPGRISKRKTRRLGTILKKQLDWVTTASPKMHLTG